ncbi:hypothetical protein AAG906_024380 [Vitis piasezkii]
MDAVIPTEIGLPTIRTDAAKQNDANTELGRNLDWADEVRENASITYYNRKVRPRSFKNGTLVLRKVFENTVEVGAGKFQANWEGPYIVSKASENGAYHLQKDVPLDAILLHTAAIAEEEHVIHLLLVVRFNSSFCATRRSCKSSFCFFSMEASVRSCLTSPRSDHFILCLIQGDRDSSRSLLQPNPPEGFIVLSNGG